MVEAAGAYLACLARPLAGIIRWGGRSGRKRSKVTSHFRPIVNIKARSTAKFRLTLFPWAEELVEASNNYETEGLLVSDNLYSLTYTIMNHEILTRGQPAVQIHAQRQTTR